MFRTIKNSSNGHDATVKDILDLSLQDTVDNGKNVNRQERCRASIKYSDERMGVDGMFPTLGVEGIFCFCVKNIMQTRDQAT